MSRSNHSIPSQPTFFVYWTQGLTTIIRHSIKNKNIHKNALIKFYMIPNILLNKKSCVRTAQFSHTCIIILLIMEVLQEIWMFEFFWCYLHQFIIIFSKH